jgi:uncharacterized protein
MRQLILIIVFVLLARWLVKALRAAQAGGAGAAAGARQGAAGAARAATPALAEPMVRCAVCGVHAPKSESLSVGQYSFCCAEHARRHAAHSGDVR